MVGVSALLAEAQAAGLKVRTVGDRRVVRGPRKAEAWATALLAHKPEVVAMLADARPAARRSLLSLVPLSEIYVTLPGDEWLADGFYHMRRRVQKPHQEENDDER